MLSKKFLGHWIYAQDISEDISNIFGIFWASKKREESEK